ncbi:BTAD domain-containing putative transcriptional regulator [Streptomyces sp. NPDC001393]
MDGQGHPSTRLWFGLLGPMVVQGAPGTVIPLRALKRRMLLALLLLEPNRVVARDRIESVLWGEHPPATARASLNNYVVQLRRSFGPGRTRLRTVPTGYLLEVQPSELDTREFGRMLAEAKAARERGEHAAVMRETTAALALWRDEPFADLPELADVTEPYAVHLRELRLLALEWRLDAGLELGLMDDAVLELNRLVAEHPLREAFHRQLMLIHHRSGRQADALLAFERAREVFAEELGVDPGRELRDLHQLVLAQDQGPSRIGAIPLPTPSQLPGSIADFCGRHDEAARLRALLAAPSEPTTPTLVAITGVGGCGKTTLALHVAHQVAARYPDGRLFADLRGADATPVAPGEILADFLRALGVADADIPADQGSRAALYRSVLAGRRVLVVLDNARDAAQLRSLLPGTAGCAVVATSRRTLAGLAGVTRMGLGPLADAEAYALFGAIAGAKRIAAEPTATSQVLFACGGLPLALRIAAARLAARPSWSVSALAAKLAHQHRRLDELHTDDLAVRASFRLSYDSLPDAPGIGGPDPKRAFRILGLLPGADISLSAAAAALDRPESGAEEELEHLVDVGLLDSPAPDRYRLHDLLGLFAAERAAEEESGDSRRDAVQRATEWFLGTLINADAVLFPGAVRPDPLPPDDRHPSWNFASFEEALAWCETERPTVVALASLATEYGLHDLAWRIPGFAWAYFNLKGHFQDWLATTETGLASARGCQDPVAEAAIATSQGAALMCLDQVSRARDCLTRALTVLERIDDPPGRMTCLSTLGAVLHRQRKYDEARECYLRALALAGSPQTRHREATLLVNLAHAETESGDHEAALGHLDRARHINLELGDRALSTSILKLTGRSMARLGRIQEAETTLRQALAMARSAAYDANEAFCGLFLAQSLAGSGRAEEAASQLHESRALIPRLRGWDARMIREILTETEAMLQR